ncbi:hypothetical protein A3D14_01180 [Candidatus Saccharibacteria bacterium RIFCSPHIGHO2_02_FULL_47_12]|nr:MAG: hypothetical protein A3D14_01180 [Candidatus Saccharibacteria bacterium RIFCSPHIGHO2_02_FULL_47_12]
MAEILLVRHAKSYANQRDFTAFGNVDSPLVEKGVKQAQELAEVLKNQYGIIPSEYDLPVVSSEFVRPQQTAQIAGFKKVHIHPVINEAEFDRTVMGVPDPVAKHARERWAPDETRERAKRLIEIIRTGELNYTIFFTHGLFIAATLLELSEEAQANGHRLGHEFTEDRGFIPRLATITPVEI